MIKDLAKKSILELKAYGSHEYAYKYKMDANESPFDFPENIREDIKEYIKSFNRYPNSNSINLKKELKKYTGLNEENILVGNGSDELINIIINTFLEKEDYVICHSPTFVMYSIYTKIAGGKYFEIGSDEDFNIDIDTLIETAKKKKAKIIFLTSPNNPTGNIIKKQEVIKVIENVNGIVVVDEAYIEFGGESAMDEIKKHKNLIVLRTFSKAFGSAGIRVGYLGACEEVIHLLNVVRSPYNLNSFSECMAVSLLKNEKIMKDNINFLIKERDRMYEAMRKIEGIKTYPSNGNFILFKAKKNKNIFECMLQKGILIRKFNGETFGNHLRVSVGKKEENDLFLDTLREVL